MVKVSVGLTACWDRLAHFTLLGRGKGKFLRFLSSIYGDEVCPQATVVCVFFFVRQFVDLNLILTG